MAANCRSVRLRLVRADRVGVWNGFGTKWGNAQPGTIQKPFSLGVTDNQCLLALPGATQVFADISPGRLQCPDLG